MEPTPINVLLIEDAASDARLLCEHLGHASYARFIVESAGQVSSAIQRLAKPGIDVVLMDLILPDGRGIDALREVIVHAPQIPILVVSGFHDEEVALEALQYGAQDYLFKEYVDAQILERAIRSAIERKRITNALHEQTRILQSILNSMADGVVVVEQSGKCILSNPAAERIAGFCSDGLPHDQWPVRYGLCKGDLKTPHPPEELPLARACQGETVKEQEVGIRHGRLPEGVVVSVNATPLRDEKGHIGGGVAVLRDITLRHLAEDQIRQLKTVLEEA